MKFILTTQEEFNQMKSWHFITFICSWCGDIGHRSKYYIQKRNKQQNTYRNIFCSTDCFYSHNKNKAWSSVTCNGCGKTFDKKNTEIKRVKKNYCSHECFINSKWKTGSLKKRRKLSDISKEQFIKAIKESISIKETLSKLNLGISGSNYNFFHSSVKKYNINTKHFTGQGWSKGLKRNNLGFIPLKEVLVKESTYRNTNSLKKKLIKIGLKKHECEVCQRTTWNEKPIPIQLDHINGTRNDNRIENLRIICPNCHAQTNTYCGKNKGKN